MKRWSSKEAARNFVRCFSECSKKSKKDALDCAKIHLECAYESALAAIESSVAGERFSRKWTRKSPDAWTKK